MEDLTAARVPRAQGAGTSIPQLGHPRGGGPAGGVLKPESKVTMGGDRPPRLGVGVFTFGDMREIIVAYSEYKQQMHITNQDGGDRILARGRELVDSATQMMVANDFLDGKPWIDLCEEEPMQGLKMLAGVHIQQTSDENFRRQIFRVLKTDATVPVDSRVFMKKRALRKYLDDSGPTEVVRAGGWQNTLKYGRVLVEAIAAGIEPSSSAANWKKIYDSIS